MASSTAVQPIEIDECLLTLAKVDVVPCSHSGSHTVARGSIFGQDKRFHYVYTPYCKTCGTLGMFGSRYDERSISMPFKPISTDVWTQSSAE